VLFFEFIRCLVFEGLVNSLRVEEGFDVPEDAGSGLIDIGKGFELRPLMFERPEESFHDGVVVTATGVVHDTTSLAASPRFDFGVSPNCASSTWCLSVWHLSQFHQQS
jgi:hypothetical protein